MVVVVNRIKLRVPVADLAADVAREFGPAFRSLAGFRQFYFVQAAEREAIVVIAWDSAEDAKAGADVIGPTLFNRMIAPHAESQDRVVGPVLASAEA